MNRYIKPMLAAVIATAADKFGFELEQSPAGAENLRLVIQASEPQSNGITVPTQRQPLSLHLILSHSQRWISRLLTTPSTAPLQLVHLRSS